MILFYSDYCLHCRMLIETIKRHDSKGMIKLACIENIRATKGKIPSQITHVPALMILPTKKLIFGKNVFDYLLLPNQGILMMQPPEEKENVKDTTFNEKELGEPFAFSFNNNSSYSDSFSEITETNKSFNDGDLLKDRTYNWTLIEDEPPEIKEINSLNMQEETRVRKTLDLDAYKIERDLALKQNDLNQAQLPVAENTR